MFKLLHIACHIYQYIINKINDVESGHLDDIERIFPAEIIEQEINISNISRIYKMPYGLNEKQIENALYYYLSKGNKKFINIIFEKILEINQLDLILEKDYIPNKSVFIGGFCSRIRIDDIIDYDMNSTEIIRGPFEDDYYPGYIVKRKDKESEKEYSDLLTFLFKKKITIGYFPSIKTLKKIKRKLVK